MTDDTPRREFVKAVTATVAAAGIAGCLDAVGGSGDAETSDGMTEGGMNENSSDGEMSDAGMDGGTETDGMSDGTESGEMGGSTESSEMGDGGMAESDQSTHTFAVTITNVSEPGTITTSDGEDHAVPLSPGAYAVLGDGAAAFGAGETASDGLESLAEDGAPEAFVAELDDADGVETAGAFTTPDGADEAGPLKPGESFGFEVEAGHGTRLSLTTMFAQSNDLFYAPDPGGIALFEDDEPIGGDVTDEFALWDAGTEENEEPGAGSHQAPRQMEAGSGPDEMGAVRRIDEVDDGYDYPDVGEVLEVRVTAM